MVLIFTNTPPLCQKFLEAQALYSATPYKVRYHPGEVSAMFNSHQVHYTALNKMKKFLEDYRTNGETIKIDLNQ